VDDYAIVAMNLGAVVNLVDNDSDAENNLRDHNGNVQASQISITTGGTSFRGGSVIPMVNGAIYTPPPGFSGIDYFRYRVTDNPDDDLSNPPAGLTSNEVNVWIKVK
ncbi:Ig-like domain-containing protein, partial [Thiolapillus sp.]